MGHLKKKQQSRDVYSDIEALLSDNTKKKLEEPKSVHSSLESLSLKRDSVIHDVKKSAVEDVSLWKKVDIRFEFYCRYTSLPQDVPLIS